MQALLHDKDHLINPPYHSGNTQLRHLSEEEQQEMCRHFQAHGASSCYTKYSVGKPRLQLVLGKYGIDWESGRGKPKAKEEVPIAKLESMRGHTYDYCAKHYLITGYEVLDDFVRLHYLYPNAQRPEPRSMKLKKKGLGKELGLFRKLKEGECG